MKGLARAARVVNGKMRTGRTSAQNGPRWTEECPVARSTIQIPNALITCICRRPTLQVLCIRSTCR